MHKLRIELLDILIVDNEHHTDIFVIFTPVRETKYLFHSRCVVVHLSLLQYYHKR